MVVGGGKMPKKAFWGPSLQEPSQTTLPSGVGREKPLSACNQCSYPAGILPSSRPHWVLPFLAGKGPETGGYRIILSSLAGPIFQVDTT